MFLSKLLLYALVMIDPLTRPQKLSNAALLFLVLAPIAVVSYAVYIFDPSHRSNLFAYGLQLIADTFSIITVTGLWLTILIDLLTPAHQFEDREGRHTFLKRVAPTIDIFIPTAGEPPAVVEKTIAAAVAADYPHNTIILDDANSDVIKALAEKYGANYIRRSERRKAKSGNINNGLGYSTADFFAILDADFVADKKFLTTLLPYMDDPKLAFVQSPQFYTNQEYFIARGTAQAQDVFYRYVLPSRNSSESSFCVGTNVIFRRAAINEIGGMFEVDHSEDVWTSIALHERGWRSLFVNKVLARGLAPDNTGSFFRQQRRWAKGGFSVFFEKKPLLTKGLSFDQRVQYFFSSTFYFVGISITIYLLLPIFYLLFGISPIRADEPAEWLIHYVPFFFIFYALPIFLTGRFSIALISTSMSAFYPYLLALGDTLARKRFKWVSAGSRMFTLRDQPSFLVWPHIMLISLSIAGVVVAWVQATDPLNVMINSFWALMNAALLTFFVLDSFRALAELSATAAASAPARLPAKS